MKGNSKLTAVLDSELFAKFKGRLAVKNVTVKEWVTRLVKKEVGEK